MNNLVKQEPKKAGRPRIFEDGLKSVTIRIPFGQVEAIQEYATNKHITQAQAHREAIFLLTDIKA